MMTAPVAGTPLFESDQRGEVDHMDEIELTAELREFLRRLELRSSVFRSNHASNRLQLAGTLSKDKPALLAQLDRALADPAHAPFVPRWLRGL